MSEHYPFVNGPLPYDYNALEPFIDEKTMHLHHDKHLQTYTDNLNLALKDYPQYQRLSLQELIYYGDRLPLTIRQTVHNNAGGVFNHMFYFNGMTSNQIISEENTLIKEINNTFGSFEKFKDLFKKAALKVFGSGYAMLVSDAHCRLKIITTANQDTAIPKKLKAIIIIDVWEHAYYLKHYNKRTDYVDDYFNVIDYKIAEKNFSKKRTEM